MGREIFLGEEGTDAAVGWLLENVEDGGGQPERSAGEGRSLLIDQHVDVELTQGATPTT
jgi:hypothetical protein